MKRSIALGFGVVALIVGSVPAHAVTIVLPRPGQVGVGVQFQYGGLLQAGELGNEFGYGPGMNVRLRYRMRYDRALGLSFEARRLDSRSPEFNETAFLASPDSIPRTRLALQTYGVDIYQFFGTRSRTQEYLSATGGLARISAQLADGETTFPIAGDGVFVAVGAGFERFVYRSWALDCSVRYSAIVLDGSTNHDVQAAVGMTFYAAY